MGKTVLSILAHPDDAEFLCAGTLTRLRHEYSWTVHIATMTAGDCGSTALPAGEISRVRRAEAAQAASIIGAIYHCLELLDLRILYNEEALERVTRLLRAVRPDMVLTHSPQDYLLDHEMTSTVTRAAAFAAPVPNFLNDRGHAQPLDRIPHLYYCDAVEGKGLFFEQTVKHAPSKRTMTAAALERQINDLPSGLRCARRCVVDIRLVEESH